MINLDSITFLLVGDSAIADIDKACFIDNIKTDKGEIIQDISELKAEHKVKGLNKIEIDNLKQTCKIDLSAKILRENYYHGINLNSIDNLIDNLNKNHGILFYPDNFLDESAILKCDCTDNLKVEKPIGFYVKDLSLYRINNKYTISDYDNDSIVFKRDVKTYKERIIFYNKEHEILRDKEMAHILYDSKKMNDFKNILRCESNHTNFKTIRERFSVPNIYKNNIIELNDKKLIPAAAILNSNKKVNYDLVQRITEKELPTLFYNYDNLGFSFNEIEKREGRKRIIHDCNYDIKIIRELIQRHVKGNISKYLREYKQLIAEVERERESISGGFKSSIESNINEIRELLKAV